MEFITKNKQEAEDKLKTLFSNSIVSDVRKEWDNYAIQRLTPDEFYNHSVDSQKEMKGYYEHLVGRLDVDLVAVADRLEKINDQLWYTDTEATPNTEFTSVVMDKPKKVKKSK